MDGPRTFLLGAIALHAAHVEAATYMLAMTYSGRGGAEGYHKKQFDGLRQIVKKHAVLNGERDEDVVAWLAEAQHFIRDRNEVLHAVWYTEDWLAPENFRITDALSIKKQTTITWELSDLRALATRGNSIASRGAGHVINLATMLHGPFTDQEIDSRDR